MCGALYGIDFSAVVPTGVFKHIVKAADAKVDAAAQVAGGSLLALGRFPRVAALVLAGSIVPTTLAGHRFWEEADSAKKQGQLLHFLKNASMLGGLLLAAVDTAGKESLAHKTTRITKRSKRKRNGNGK